MFQTSIFEIILLLTVSRLLCQQASNPLRVENFQPHGDLTRQCECWVWPACISNCTANPILKILFENEHKKIAKIKTPFIVTFPFQVRRQKAKKVYTNTLNRQGQYRMAINFWVQLLNGKDVQLRLQKSKIFGNESISPNNYLLKYYQQSGEIVSNNLRKCFYIGSVFLDHSDESTDQSYVAVDTCDGLRGIIQNKGNVFGIMPLKHPNSKENEPIAHFIYPETTSTIERVPKSLKSFWHMVGIAGDSDMSTDNLIYVVPVSLFLDHTLMKAFQLNVDRAAHFALSLLNQVTKSFISLKEIDLQLATIELWNVHDKLPVSQYIKTTLNDFLKLHLKTADSMTTQRLHRGEISILLSGVQFTEDVEYFSIPGSICTKRSLSVVQVISTEETYHISRLISLAIAEIFGINSFPCPESYGCSSTVVLSKGDESRLKLALLSGQANCLKKESSAMVINTCGNGKIDRGEECDIYANTEGSEELKCCDRLTCMVANYAQCTGGECCSNNCTFHFRGKICRPSKDNCDIPEFCIGDTDSCPKDLFLENGIPCNKGSALCYQGRCPTRDSKCQTLWGQRSKEANQHCYSNFNLKHDDSCGSQRKCSIENQMCGVLHCQGGTEKPNDSIFPKDTQRINPIFIDTYLQFQEEKIQCKYLNNIESAFVEDGTECGVNKYCFGKTCMSPTSKIISKCPSDVTRNETKKSVCYNKGICTNLGICLCYPGWSGKNCSIATNDSIAFNEFGYAEQTKNYIWAYFKEVGMYNGSLSQRSEAINFKENMRSLTTVHLILILGAVICVMFILLSLFMIFYRRKGDRKPERSDGYISKSQKGRILKAPDSAHYHGYITEDGTKIIGRKHNLNSKGHNEVNSNSDSNVNGGGKCRGRRHKRRSSNLSGSRRLYRDNGDGDESVEAVSDYTSQEHEWSQTHPGGAKSDNDINKSCHVRKMNEDLRSSIEKIIKFGNMPSYKEDKLNRSVDNSPSNITNVVNLSQDTDSSLLTRSSDPLLTNFSSPCNSESQSLLRTPTNSYPSSQGCNSFLSPIPPSASTSPLPISNADRTDPISFTNKLFSPPFGLPAPALFPSIPYNSNPMATVSMSTALSDKIFDASIKQPEKGILKNKSASDLNEMRRTSKAHKGSHTCSKRHKQKRCGTTTNDSNSGTSPSSGSQSSLSSCDSDSQSCSSSSSSSSSPSSITSSLATPPHGRKSSRKQKMTNLRSLNNPLPAPPTILCNAGNQTEEMNNNNHSNTSNSTHGSKSPKHILTNNDDKAEECDEEECEECIKVRRGQRNKTPLDTLLTSNSSAYDIVGSADDGYHHYNPNHLQFNQDLSVHYDCHAIQQSYPQSGYSLPSTHEEHSEQSSETEVDSHLQMLMNHPSNLYPNGAINKYILPVPFTESQKIAETTIKRLQDSGHYNQSYNSSSAYPYYYGRPSSQETEDLNSDARVSAYCRIPQSDNHLPRDLDKFRPVVIGSETFNNVCFDGTSNDETVEGSDTSSLPDSHCDLLNLANLGIAPSRPNPMLSCLLRAQSKVPDHYDVSNKVSLSNSGWLPSRKESHSPGQLPHPTASNVDKDYLV